MSPNILGPLSFAVYPLFALTLFAMLRPPVAVAITLMMAEMVLPPGYHIDLPLIVIDKGTIPVFTSLVGVAIFGRRYLARTRPFGDIEKIFLLVIVVRFFTATTNGDAIHYPKVDLPGETMHDFVTESVHNLYYYWAPFYLGRALFRTSRDVASLARVMVIGALVYTFPILLEIRLSPQICNWIYGYSPSEFGQAVRWGGYRPVVLFTHGLGLSLFMFFCTIMAAAAARARIRISAIPVSAATWFLVFILIICKSTGTIIYALVLVPMVLYTKQRRVMTFAVVLAIFVFVYPLLRLADVLPTEKLGAYISSYNADRAQSLLYRFDMEQQTLARVRNRLFFGWGGYGRPFTYDKWSGRSETVLDSFAFIVLAMQGLCGYLAFFTWFTGGVFLARRKLALIRERVNRNLICGLAVVVAICAFDLLINATIYPFLTMLSGALVGAVRGLQEEELVQAQTYYPPSAAAPPARAG